MHIVIPTKSGLPPSEHSFCHFIVSDPQMNEADAYLKINPDIKRKSAVIQAHRFLEKDAVREYIGVLLEARQKRMEMNEDWVVAKLRDIHDRCMQSEPVFSALQLGSDKEDGEEPSPVFYKFDAAGAIKALELIGKHMKMFSDKTDAGTTNVQININLGYDEKTGKDKPAIEGSFERVG